MTPKRLKRPRDPVQLGKLVGDILTGQVQEVTAPTSAAAEMGSKGGKARAAALTKKRRAEIARAAAAKRWQE
jgi:hypothetical protein